MPRQLPEAVEALAVEPLNVSHASAKYLQRKFLSHFSDMASAIHPEEVPDADALALFDFEEIDMGKQLGSGGFCTVYEVAKFRLKGESHEHMSESVREARDVLTFNAETTRKKYAVKFLQPDLVQYEKHFRVAARDLENEAAMLSQVNHPHILKIQGAAQEQRPGQPDQYFLILDCLEETLEDRMERWRKETRYWNRPVMRKLLNKRGIKRKMLAERLRVATQVASALQYLHENRIIFRDLKPNNIGFDSLGDTKLFDFGLSRFLPTETGSGEQANMTDTFQMSGRVGTYRFMAPEIALKQPYNTKADVYSFSHLLYEMLTLEKPYVKYSRKQHRDYVAWGGERPSIHKSWPKEIQDLLERAWSPVISERPTMAEISVILTNVVSELTDTSNDTVCTDESVELSKPAAATKEMEGKSITFVPRIISLPIRKTRRVYNTQ